MSPTQNNHDAVTLALDSFSREDMKRLFSVRLGFAGGLLKVEFKGKYHSF